MDDTRPEVGEGKPARRPASLWWRLTVGLVIPLLAAAACLVVLWSLVPPVVFYPLYVLAWGALIIVGVVWLVAVVFGSIRYGWRGVTLVAPVIVLVTVGLAAAELPGRFGWWVSKDDLQRAAVACADPADAADVRSQRIGVYRVHSVQRVGDRGCRFTVEGGLVDFVGVAYLPGERPYLGEPRRDGDIGYRHIEGDWYAFVQRF